MAIDLTRFGSFQTACDVGKFGAGCLQECHCQNQDSCDRFTGQCDSAGCQASWNGHNCQGE